ncbi:piggyBac transposable element-derived protein 4-like [Aphis craccivora]|uniref:PiggyBac transposable element-derived protein 4-like n=1 Tax=Aphis craccivora TaxID=307492 RepID=A0A6G0Y6P8_APHCR|nr:piggyBac transposable element-derived protein 4-like [Aphis craccivora]
MDSDEILSALETEFEDSGSDFIPSDLSDSSDESIEDVIENSQFDFEDDIEENSNNEQTTEMQTDHWFDVSNVHQSTFPYIGNDRNICNLGPDKMIVRETNRQAKKYKRDWVDTDHLEIKKMLAIVMYTGLVTYPKLSDYWCRKLLYKNSYIPLLMPRNRFQLLLRFFHLANNDDILDYDRLGKIRPLVDMLMKTYSDAKIPGENVVIDESMIPFRGRLIFRQYLPNKSSKYGIKLYKLCDSIGYTYKIIVYSGKDSNLSLQTNFLAAGKVVMELMDGYLNEGRTLIIDNFYTSLKLAHTLLQNNTHMVGTLRKNARELPKDVMNAKIKKGEIKGKVNSKGVVAREKNRKGEPIKKPESIIFYNKHKQGIDVSDQMTSYFSPLRKTIRWYHKVAFHLEEIIMALGKVDDQIISPRSNKHKLVENNQYRNNSNRKKRSRCVGCYERLRKELGRNEAQKKCKQIHMLMKQICGQESIV